MGIPEIKRRITTYSYEKGPRLRGPQVEMGEGPLLPKNEKGEFWESPEDNLEEDEYPEDWEDKN